MTREEALEYFKSRKDICLSDECQQAYEMAISALEQEPCEDAISRDEVIDILHHAWESRMYIPECIREVKELPSVQPNPIECDDAVSREAVLSKKIYTETEEGWSGYTVNADYIEQLPSVTQKSGKWIAVYQGDEIINYRCSECELGDTNGSTNLYGWDYCRRCGARMVEPQESEEE